MNVEKKLRDSRAVLLPLLLCVPLLACATNGVEPVESRVEYRYPPDSLLVVGEDPTKPTLEQLTGPDGDKYGANYILSLELSGATRAQSLRCLALWKSVQMAIDAGATPEEVPPYCVFEGS